MSQKQLCTLFCKTFHEKSICDEAQKGRHHRCFPVNRFCEYNFFGSFHSSIPFGHVLQSRSSLKFWKTFGKQCQSFFLDKAAHHQACNSIKNRCFTVNFEKLLKARCITSMVGASNFNLIFLTLGRERRISTFSQHQFFFFDNFKPFHVPYRS